MDKEDLVKLFRVVGETRRKACVCRVRYKHGLLDKSRDTLVQQVFDTFGTDLGRYVRSFYNRALDHALLLQRDTYAVAHSCDVVDKVKEAHEDLYFSLLRSGLSPESAEALTAPVVRHFHEPVSWERVNSSVYKVTFGGSRSEYFDTFVVAVLYFTALLKERFLEEENDEFLPYVCDLQCLQDVATTTPECSVPVPTLFRYLTRTQCVHAGRFAVKSNRLRFTRFGNKRASFVSAKFVEPNY